MKSKWWLWLIVVIGSLAAGIAGGSLFSKFMRKRLENKSGEESELSLDDEYTIEE